MSIRILFLFIFCSFSSLLFTQEKWNELLVPFEAPTAEGSSYFISENGKTNVVYSYFDEGLSATVVKVATYDAANQVWNENYSDLIYNNPFNISVSKKNNKHYLSVAYDSVGYTKIIVYQSDNSQVNKLFNYLNTKQGAFEEIAFEKGSGNNEFYWINNMAYVNEYFLTSYDLETNTFQSQQVPNPFDLFITNLNIEEVGDTLFLGMSYSNEYRLISLLA
jgi:hypothetical protein